MLATSLWALPLPVSAILGALAGLVYLICCARRRRNEFTMMDALILVLLMAIVTAMAMPLITAADDRAKASALAENLRVYRRQIELYKLEHGGQAPLLFRETFPQLTEATNAQGTPGPPGKERPFGPYFANGLPINPYTGSSVVELTESFPPTTCGTAGGWLYDQATGRIAAAEQEWLTK